MKLFRRLSRSEEGFTLIELLIVIAILGILAGIAVPRITGTRAEAAKAALTSTASSIRNALEMYYAAEGEYPTIAAGAITSSNPGFDAGTSNISIDLSGAAGLSIKDVVTSADPDTYQFVIYDEDWQVEINSASGVQGVVAATP